MLKRIRLSAFVFLAALACAPAFSQNSSGQSFPQKQYWASDYGTWQIQSQTANTYTFFPISICTVPTASQGSFFPFNTNAPVYIKDSTAANSEVLLPSAVTPSASNPSSAACGVTIAPVNNHYSFSILSGTAGLQEVLNQIPSSTAYTVEVDLDRNWYAAIGSVPGKTAAGTIASVTGSQAAYIVDKTVVPWQFYSWNGTKYSPSASNATAPTPTAGAGAGGSPTIALVAGSTGTSGSVTLTTGTTPTASAAIMTLTWPAIASGGFQYAPSCTITSTGTRAYTSGVTTTTAGPPATAVLTASATALTASVSGYVFNYTCH
jgi:hypothetical protein